jgi:hypothetical protein
VVSSAAQTHELGRDRVDAIEAYDSGLPALQRLRQRVTRALAVGGSSWPGRRRGRIKRGIEESLPREAEPLALLDDEKAPHEVAQFVGS